MKYHNPPPESDQDTRTSLLGSSPVVHLLGMVLGMEEAAESSPTMCCQGGESCLWDAPGAPFSATLPAGAHLEQIISVRVEVENQELAVPPNEGVLILAPPTAGTPVLQPIVGHCKVLVHLVHNKKHQVDTHSVCVRVFHTLPPS